MRILWIKSELLHPLDKGGKIRTFQMLKHLMFEHQITYLSLVRSEESTEAFEKAGEYCHRLVTIPWTEPQRSGARFYLDFLSSLTSRLPYAIWKYRSPSMQSAIGAELRDHDYDVVVCDFLVASINLPRISHPSILFQHNVESIIWQRHFETERNLFKRALLWNQWRRMARYERDSCRRFDAVVSVSEIDSKRMRKDFGLRHVFDVPTGVDTNYFRPIETPSNPFELVFTGSMDWVPNEDAIQYFADNILPIVARAIPECTLTVVGRNPSPALMQLGESNPRIRILGRVDDVREYIASSAAYVVPIRIGGGTRLKIFEAMAMGKPVVSTSVGAEGLPVSDERDVLIANEPEEFAARIVRLLREPVFAASLGEAARSLVCEKFGWEHAAGAFAQICEQVAAMNIADRSNALGRSRKYEPEVQLERSL